MNYINNQFRRFFSLFLLFNLFLFTSTDIFPQRDNETTHQTFNYTGTAQVFTVPDGVTLLKIEMTGGSGGHTYKNGYTYGWPGLGGKIISTLHVMPGQQLSIYVGGAGSDGTINNAGKAGYNGGAEGGFGTAYAGGGGGGASDIRLYGTSLENRLLVAGGGGASGKFGAGGNGGGLMAADGYGQGENAGGGSQQKGGLFGNFCNSYFALSGGFGNGGGSSAGINGGGGGGGWYGGGGGALGDGGGGSSYAAETATNTKHIQGCNEGDGYVTIQWSKNVTIKNAAKSNLVLENNATIFPNPSLGDFTIRLHNAMPGNAEISLQSSDGFRVLKMNCWLPKSNALVKYSIPAKIPGLYMVTVTTNSGKQTGKIVIE